MDHDEEITEEAARTMHHLSACSNGSLMTDYILAGDDLILEKIDTIAKGKGYGIAKCVMGDVGALVHIKDVRDALMLAYRAGARREARRTVQRLTTEVDARIVELEAEIERLKPDAERWRNMENATSNLQERRRFDRDVRPRNVGDKIGPIDFDAPTHEIVDVRHGQGDLYVTIRDLKTGQTESTGVDSASLFNDWKVFEVPMERTNHE